MGEMVNRIFDVASQWQRQIIWIRINVGYIRAELGYLSASGHDVSNIQALLDSFDSTFEQFCRNELGVFVAARLSETDQKETNTPGQLRQLRESFSSWLDDYNDVVEAMEKKAADSHGPLVLLHGCGGELLNAHSRFVKVIDQYLEEFKSPTRHE